METTYEILIADRNPHIRDFLRRELGASGYTVQMVENSKELLKQIDANTLIRLLILDPDFPAIDSIDLGCRLAGRSPHLPVIMHCVRGADNALDLNDVEVVNIEKNGRSIEVLKQTIHDMLISQASSLGK
jgi:DNA-binding NtrC family response regulator